MGSGTFSLASLDKVSAALICGLMVVGCSEIEAVKAQRNFVQPSAEGPADKTVSDLSDEEHRSLIRDSHLPPASVDLRPDP